MISIKQGTKTWSPAEQQSSLRGDGTQTISAADRENVLGEGDIGEHLNKIADPNWVDPAKKRRVGNNELDKDAFLKLFLTTLKNQDPMNPLESHELAAQLAQFTSLEKLNNIDTGINTLAKQQNPDKNFDALNMIGRGIGGDSSKISRTDLKADHEVEFRLGAAAMNVELSIKNAAGQEVKKLIASNLKAGPNKVRWDGVIESGAPAPEGEYSVDIVAKNSSGQKIAAETRFEGIVTGVNFTNEGAILMVGQQSIKMKDVKKIFSAEAVKNTAKLVDSKAVAGKDAKNLMDPKMAVSSNLESVGMSQGLINKLEKEAASPEAKKE